MNKNEVYFVVPILFLDFFRSFVHFYAKQSWTKFFSSLVEGAISYFEWGKKEEQIKGKIFI